jgi:ElaB/YqjD/DUF883 family membrane-anchored ribosome-binding protein
MEQPNMGNARTSGPVADSLTRSKQAIGAVANDAIDAAASDLESLRRDLNGLKDTLSSFMAQAGGEAVKSARDVSEALKAQGAEFAVGAAERGKSLITEIEAAARRNPIGTLAVAFAFGLVLASWGRRR